MHHSPLSYLDKDPAEAAEFLARTAIASRMVGGYIKTARLEKDAAGFQEYWDRMGQGMGEGVRNTLAASALGAGIGGLGGATIGALGRRRRPGSAALTGALMGGLLGGAGYGAYHLNSLPSSLDTIKDLNDRQNDVNTAREIRGAPAHERLGATVGRTVANAAGLGEDVDPNSETGRAIAEQTIGGNLADTGREIGTMVRDNAGPLARTAAGHPASDPAPYLAGSAAAGTYWGTRGGANRIANLARGEEIVGAGAAPNAARMPEVPAAPAPTPASGASGTAAVPPRVPPLTTARQILAKRFGLGSPSALRTATRGIGAEAQALRNMELAGKSALKSEGAYSGLLGRGLKGRVFKSGLTGLGAGLATELAPGLIEDKAGINMPSLSRYLNTGQAFRPGQNWFTGE